MAKKVAVFTLPTARRLHEISNQFQPGTPRIPVPNRPSVSSRVLVRLTTVVTGGNLRVWNAIEVFLDILGAATDVVNGLVFDFEDPIYTVTDAAEGDVLACERESRDTGIYWIGGAAGGGGGGARKLVQNKTTVVAGGAGTWELLGALDQGSFADEAALLAAHPSPGDNEYALTTDTGNYWIATDGLWADTGSTSKAAAGIEGSWIATQRQGVPYIVDCIAGAYLFITPVGDLFYANENFAIYRGG